MYLQSAEVVSQPAILKWQRACCQARVQLAACLPLQDQNARPKRVDVNQVTHTVRQSKLGRPARVDLLLQLLLLPSPGLKTAFGGMPCAPLEWRAVPCSGILHSAVLEEDRAQPERLGGSLQHFCSTCSPAACNLQHGSSAMSAPLEQRTVACCGDLLSAVLEEDRARSERLRGSLQHGVHLRCVHVAQIAPLCLQPPVHKLS